MIGNVSFRLTEKKKTGNPWHWCTDRGCEPDLRINRNNTVQYYNNGEFSSFPILVKSSYDDLLRSYLKGSFKGKLKR